MHEQKKEVESSNNSRNELSISCSNQNESKSSFVRVRRFKKQRSSNDKSTEKSADKSMTSDTSEYNQDTLTSSSYQTISSTELSNSSIKVKKNYNYNEISIPYKNMVY